MNELKIFLQKIRSSGKRVLVVGLGLSGYETARFLASCGIKARVVERQSEAHFTQTDEAKNKVTELKTMGVELRFEIDGEAIAAYLADVGLAVMSPGVPLDSAAGGMLRREKIPLIGELELGVQLTEKPTVVVTGSNGKSTTVSLIHHLLHAAGKKSYLCGNIGTAVTSVLSENILDSETALRCPLDLLVVEASSYQLESCALIKPKVGVFLNLSENHLERHGTMERYFESKALLFTRQAANDILVVNCDEPHGLELARRSKSQVVGFGKVAPSQWKFPFVRIEYSPKDAIDRLVWHAHETSETFELKALHLIGLHNRYNVAAAVAAVISLGVFSEEIVQGLLTFHPLEHRLETCAPFHSTSFHGALFINDSKATTVAASLAGLSATLEGYPERKIYLLLGGLAKAGSWRPLLEYVNREEARIGRIVCFGKDGPLIANHCREQNISAQLVPTLEAAVQAVATVVGPKDLVLLSPGCASFDSYSGFEDRGKAFKKMVSDLR